MTKLIESFYKSRGRLVSVVQPVPDDEVELTLAELRADSGIVRIEVDGAVEYRNEEK